MAATHTACAECGVPLSALRLQRRAVTCSARCAQARQQRIEQQRYQSKRRDKAGDSRIAASAKTTRSAKANRSTIKKKDPPLLRRWQFVQQLSAAKNGVTVRQLAHDAGIGLKTVRRDLIMLRQVGFHVVETIGERGRKDWRILLAPDRTRSRKGRYRRMRDLMEQALEHATRLGDQKLVSRVRVVQDRVRKECR